MSSDKKFLRKCIGCGKYAEKKDLIKITSVKNEDEVFINPDDKHFGRSCYVCKEEKCVDMAFKKSKISKILRKNVENSLKEKIITVLNTLIVLKHE